MLRVYLALTLLLAFMPSGETFTSSRLVCIPVEAPVQTGPEDGLLIWSDRDGSREVRLEWMQPAGVEQFQVETYTSTLDRIEDIVVGMNGVFIHFTHIDGTYHWRVRSLHPDPA